ncbi:hypothetical protein FYK55_09780 [Roseiconus nitratireducens]|uniref:Uncharacterized protein n=1 Tax=Roseiconus nitratireducens TaxID=2605748 RepID=A0A5M6DAK1_9BACT|nr:hypothetical protein [Roseiconus nitratireducens]KAA5544594.1 hypothetical protein FYK55_09780 [Roseiconus nitratireducens]
MRCSITYRHLLIAIALMSITTTSVQAGWHDFWHKVGVGYHRNNAWPDPFNEMDAMAVITPFETMKVNGWRLHNTIGAEQFRNSDGALLTAGQERLRWIATQAPPNRRQVFVLRGRTPDQTDARIASVKEALDRFNIRGPAPEIAIIDREPPTAPGNWATQINRTWLQQLPSPKLPGTSAAGTASATR